MLGLRSGAGPRASYEAWSTFLLHAGPTSRRSISSSSRAQARPVGHYEALSLPRNATRQQVKARFYELSKRYHPDAPGGNTAKFHEINDAYATLGNDNRRRQYDQSTSPSSAGGWHPSGGIHRPHRTAPHPSWARAGPRRSANAGGGQAGYHNPFSQRAPPNYDPFSPRSPPPPPGYARATSDPFGRMGRRRAGGGGPGEGDGEIRSEGALWRFVVVVGLLVAVVSFGGGLTASADEGVRDDDTGDVGGAGERGTGEPDETRGVEGGSGTQHAQHVRGPSSFDMPRDQGRKHEHEA